MNGCNSHSLPAISGVLQGSVLGPLLFISYINDVTSVISSDSDLNLFADDIVLYRVIKNPADFDQLQSDINSVSSGKHLKFNASKCRQMFISRKKVNSLKPPCFKIEGTALTPTNEYKYLGVTITSDLTWKPHITNICNKTRKLIGLFYRRFYNNCSSQTLLKLYLSYIRPHLEYSSAVWNPHLKGEIADIEKVQKFALRVCLKSPPWDPLTSYNDLFTAAKLPTLQSRRDQSSICHLFKIVNGLIDFPNASIRQCEFHYNSRSANSAALSIPYFHTSSHQNSFFPATITKWNHLLVNHELSKCNTIDSFKYYLSKHVS